MDMQIVPKMTQSNAQAHPPQNKGEDEAVKEAATQRYREAPVWPKCPCCAKACHSSREYPHTHTLLSPLGMHDSSQEGSPLKPLSAAQTRMVFALRVRGADSIPPISFTSVRLGRYRALASVPGRSDTVRLS